MESDHINRTPPTQYESAGVKGKVVSLLAELTSKISNLESELLQKSHN